VFKEGTITTILECRRRLDKRLVLVVDILPDSWVLADSFDPVWSENEEFE
jgi:hypothetical protein